MFLFSFCCSFLLFIIINSNSTIKNCFSCIIKIFVFDITRFRFLFKNRSKFWSSISKFFTILEYLTPHWIIILSFKFRIPNSIFSTSSHISAIFMFSTFRSIIIYFNRNNISTCYINTIFINKTLFIKLKLSIPFFTFFCITKIIIRMNSFHIKDIKLSILVISK